MTNSKVTLADIAKLAGVSISTVSRALADSPQISEDMKHQIKAIAQEQRYQPHLGARNLRLKRSNVIALVLPSGPHDAESLTNPFVLEFIGAVGLALRRFDCNLLLQQEKTINERYWNSGLVDGYIQLGHGAEPSKLNDLPADLPLVVWGPAFADQAYLSVCVDNWKLAQEAVEHLLKLGKRRIGIVAGRFGNNNTESYLRFQGYREALRHADIAYDPALLAYTSFDAGSSVRAMRQILAQSPDVDAFFVAHSDIVALTIMHALLQDGYRIPEDISLIGFDNISLGAHLGLPLTTASQEIRTQGAHALVDVLMKRIAGEAIESITLDGKLIIRQTCGTA